MILAFLLSLGLVRRMIATNFDVPERDRFNPNGELACRRGQQLDRVTPVVAHRRLPCGTQVLVYSPRTGRSVVAVVADRGPYGRNRGGIDLSAATARALRANGWESVVVVQLAGRGR